MKFSVKRDALLTALSSSTRVISKKSTIPVMMHVVVDADAEGLRIVAGDLDMEVSFRVPADVTDPGSTSMLAGVFAGFVDRAGTDTITLASKDDGRVLVKSGKSQVLVPTHDPADFPFLGGGADMAPAFEISGEDLAPMMRRAAYAIQSGLETAPYLGGVYIHHNVAGETSEIVCVSTNAKILMVSTHDLAADAEPWEAFILPAKAAAEVEKLAIGPVSVMASKSIVQFDFGGGVTLKTKVIEGSYPNYAVIVPGTEGASVVNTELLMASLDRIGIAVVRDNYMVVEVHADRIVLDRQTATDGSVYDEVACTGGEPTRFAVSHAYLSTALRAIGSDTVDIVADGEKMIGVRPTGKTDAVFVISPMRLRPAAETTEGLT